MTCEVSSTALVVACQHPSVPVALRPRGVQSAAQGIIFLNRTQSLRCAVIRVAVQGVWLHFPIPQLPRVAGAAEIKSSVWWGRECPAPLSGDRSG